MLFGAPSFDKGKGNNKKKVRMYVPPLKEALHLELASVSIPVAQICYHGAEVKNIFLVVGSV